MKNIEEIRLDRLMLERKINDLLRDFIYSIEPSLKTIKVNIEMDYIETEDGNKLFEPNTKIRFNI